MQAGHSFRSVKQSRKPGARKLPGCCPQTNLIELSGMLLVAGDASREKSGQILPDATGDNELISESGAHFRNCGRCCKEYGSKKLGTALTLKEMTI